MGTGVSASFAALVEGLVSFFPVLFEDLVLLFESVLLSACTGPLDPLLGAELDVLILITILLQFPPLPIFKTD
jgi:hypothetical protein